MANRLTTETISATNPPFTRRDLLKRTGQAALAFAGGGVLGCHPRGSGQEPVTIRFWNGWTGPDGAKALAIVRAFNAAHPGIQVRMQRIDWGTYYNKLFVAGIAGRAPEVFVLHTSALRRFAEAKFLEPLDALLRESAFPVDDLDANVFAATHIDGVGYALPVDIHMVGVFLNQKRFADAGIAAPPRSREEFVAAARAMTGGSGADKRWGYAVIAPSQMAMTLIYQFGGQLFTPDFSRCTLASAENADALQFCVDLARKEKVAPPLDGGDPWIAFRQGRVGMVWAGIYMLPDLQKQSDLSFAGASVPRIGVHQATWAASHNFCLKAAMSLRTREAAWLFSRYFSDNSLQWAAAGQVPVRKSLRDSAQFAQYTVQSEFAKEIPFAVYQPQIPFVFEFQTEFDYMTERVFRGTLAPAAALKEAEDNINRIIARRERERRLAFGAGGTHRG